MNSREVDLAALRLKRGNTLPGDDAIMEAHYEQADRYAAFERWYAELELEADRRDEEDDE